MCYYYYRKCKRIHRGVVMQGKKSVTINDVARVAGVSNATVSRYINNKTFVTGEKAEKIEQAIEKLSYKPNRIARGLKMQRAMQIMVVVPDIRNPYYAGMYATVQRLANNRGFTAILFNTNEEEKKELEAIRLVTELGCDGLIFCSTSDNEDIICQLQALDIPVVTSNTFGSMIFDTVHGIKSGQGVYLGTSHLIAYNHVKIAYAGGTPHSILNKRRLSGYERAMREHKLSIRKEYEFAGAFTVQGGIAAGEYFCRLPEMPTAVACANDMIAIGVMQYLQRIGKRVPEDVSVVGMDNVEYAEYFNPSITTVSNDSSEFADKAMDLLFSRIDGSYEGKPRECLCDRRLIVRNSTRRI